MHRKFTKKIVSAILALAVLITGFSGLIFGDMFIGATAIKPGDPMRLFDFENFDIGVYRKPVVSDSNSYHDGGIVQLPVAASTDLTKGLQLISNSPGSTSWFNAVTMPLDGWQQDWSDYKNGYLAFYVDTTNTSTATVDPVLRGTLRLLEVDSAGDLVPGGKTATVTGVQIAEQAPVVTVKKFDGEETAVTHDRSARGIPCAGTQAYFAVNLSDFIWYGFPSEGGDRTCFTVDFDNSTITSIGFASKFSQSFTVANIFLANDIGYNVDGRLIADDYDIENWTNSINETWEAPPVQEPSGGGSTGGDAPSAGSPRMLLDFEGYAVGESYKGNTRVLSPGVVGNVMAFPQLGPDTVHTKGIRLYNDPAGNRFGRAYMDIPPELGDWSAYKNGWIGFYVDGSSASSSNRKIEPYVIATNGTEYVPSYRAGLTILNTIPYFKCTGTDIVVDTWQEGMSITSGTRHYYLCKLSYFREAAWMDQNATLFDNITVASVGFLSSGVVGGEVIIDNVFLANDVHYDEETGKLMADGYEVDSWKPKLTVNPADYVTMREGAQIRTVSPNGLRFTSDYDKSLEEKLDGIADPDSIKQGTVLTLSNAIYDNMGRPDYSKLVKGAVYASGKAADSQADNTFDETADIRTYTAVITNLPDDRLDVSYSARPYVSYTIGGMPQAEYADTGVTRSINQVAKAALCDISANYSPSEKTMLRGIVNTVAPDMGDLAFTGLKGQLAMYEKSAKTMLGGILSGDNAAAPLIKENGVCYADISAVSAFGLTAASPNGTKAAFGKDGVSVLLTQNSATASIGDYALSGAFAGTEKRAYTLQAPVVFKNGTAYIPVEDLAVLLGKRLLFDADMGLAVFHDRAQYYADDDYFGKANYTYRLIRQNVTGAQVIADMRANGISTGEHPRLMATNADFDRMRSLYATDAVYQSYVADLADDGYLQTLWNSPEDYPEDYLTEFGFPNRVQARNMLSSHSIPYRKAILSSLILYIITEEAQYKTYLWNNLSKVCDQTNYLDWNPINYLDTAEIAYTVALAYDWLYDEWTSGERGILEAALKRNALDTGIATFERTGVTSLFPNNNWTGICNNALIMSAIALADVYPAESAKMLDYSVNDVWRIMQYYSPQGVYYEGAGYWSYGTDHLCMMIASLEGAAGSDYGLFSSPGFAESVYFPIYMESDIDKWNISDSHPGLADSSCFMFFAQKLNDPLVAYARRRNINPDYVNATAGQRPWIYDLLWYNPSWTDPVAYDLPLDVHYKGLNLATMRSNWTGDQTFTALKGGSNNVSHGHLDIGTFQFESEGVVWFEQLRYENSSLDGFWQGEEGGMRWNYYATRAEGQNTLIVNPTNKNDQNVYVDSKMTKAEFGANGGYAVIDMACSQNDFQTGQRGLLFTDNRSAAVIQDEATFKKASDVYWGAHIFDSTAIDVAPDGKSAIVTKNGQRLFVGLLSTNPSARFSVVSANSLWVPTNPLEKDRSNIKKLSVNLSGITNLKLAVYMQVLEAGQDTPHYEYALTDIANWTAN